MYIRPEILIFVGLLIAVWLILKLVNYVSRRRSSQLIRFNRFKTSEEVKQRLADELVVGQATLSRVQQFLGYQELRFGYADFRYEKRDTYTYYSSIQQNTNVDFDSLIGTRAKAPNLRKWPPSNWLFTLDYHIVFLFKEGLLQDIVVTQSITGL
jgi:hypothetical protein